MEPLPPIPDAFMAISMEEFLPLRDVYAEECIMQLRQCERELRVHQPAPVVIGQDLV